MWVKHKLLLFEHGIRLDPGSHAKLSFYNAHYDWCAYLISPLLVMISACESFTVVPSKLR